MKTYNSSDLSHKRAELIESALKEDVLIQIKNTNGKVRYELVLSKVKPAVRQSGGMKFKSDCLAVTAFGDFLMAGQPSTKGSWQRPSDKKKFDDEFDRIFSKKPKPS